MLNDMRAAIFLAVESVKKGSKATLSIVILIMSLSVFNLVFMPSILDNMSEANHKTIIEKEYGHVAIEAEEDGILLQDSESMKRKILAFPDVAGAALEHRTGATAVFKDESVQTQLIFIQPEEQKTVTTLHQDIVEGEYLSKQGKGEVLLGSEVAGRFNPIMIDYSLRGVKAGDNVVLEFGNGINRTYKITGIYKTGDVNTDYGIFLPYSEMQNIYGTEIEATHVIVKLHSGDSLHFIREVQELGIDGDVYDTVKRNGYTLEGMFGILKVIMSIIAFLVSGITLFIVVYIHAVNKKKLIATMKAIGINTRIIIMSFIAQSLFYSVMGIALGLGLVVFIMIPYFSVNPLVTPIGYVSLSLDIIYTITNALFFLGCSLIAGFIPAYQVAKQNIVQTMRS